MLQVVCIVLAKLSGYDGAFRVNPLFRFKAGDAPVFALQFVAPARCDVFSLSFVGLEVSYSAECQNSDFGLVSADLRRSGRAALLFGDFAVLRLDVSSGPVSGVKSSFFAPAHAEANVAFDLRVFARDSVGNAVEGLCSAAALQLNIVNAYEVRDAFNGADGECVLRTVIFSLMSTETVEISARCFDTQLGETQRVTLTYGSRSLAWGNCVAAGTMLAAAIVLAVRISKSYKAALDGAAVDGAVFAAPAAPKTPADDTTSVSQ